MAETDKTLSLRIKAEAEGEKEIAALTQEVEDLKSEAAKPIPDKSKEFTSGLDNATNSAEELEQALQKIQNELRTPFPTSGIKGLTVDMGQATDTVTKSRAQISKEMDAIRESTDKARQGTIDLGNQFTSAQDKLERFGQIIATVAGIKIFTDLVDEMTKIREGLTNVNGSAEKTAKDLEFLSKISNKLGLDVGAVGEQFIGLSAAAKGTNLEGDQTRKIFEAVVTAMASLGKSGEETENALRAVQQMMSKGKISAEELRGQLGEAMPIAVQTFAKALGKTTAELDKLLESGSLFADDVLPLWAAELPKAVNPVPVETFAAAFNRLFNSVKETADEFAREGGIQTATTYLTERFAELIRLGKVIPIAFKELGTMAGESAAQMRLNVAAGKSLSDSVWPNLVRIAEETNRSLGDVVKEFIGLNEEEKKAIENSQKLVIGLDRLQLAAQGTGLEKLPEVLKQAIAILQNTGNAAESATLALKEFTAEPEKLKGTEKILALSNAILILQNQVKGTAQEFTNGLGAALNKLTSEQLVSLQAESQKTLGSMQAEAINTQIQLENMWVAGTESAAPYAQELIKIENNIKGLNALIEGVTIAAFNKLGIDGREALSGMDAKFIEIIESINILTKSTEVYGQKLNEAFAKGINAATTIQEIDAIRNALIAAGDEGKLSAEQIALAMVQVNEKTATVYAQIDPLTQALQRFGIDSTEAFTGLDAEMQASIQTLDVLANSARITGDVLYQAISESIDAANTVAELETLKAKIEEFGRSGELSGNQVKQAIAELNVKLQDANKEIDPLAKAFENLGVTSAKELKAIADQAQVSFDLIKNSGTATTAEIANAFVSLAEKQLAAAAAQGREAEIATQLRLKAIAETGKYGEALNEIVKKFTQIEEKSKASGDAQTENIDKTTQALKAQQDQLEAIEKSMVGIQASTIKVGNQMAVAFDTQGIRQFNALAKDVNNWLEQANVAIASLNAGDWNAVSNARSLATSMGDVSGYMDDTVKTVKDDLVNAIQDATDSMKEFAQVQQDALKNAVEDLEDLRAANDEFAQEQLRHKRELAELEESLFTAQQQRNQAAIDAIMAQMSVEEEKHRLIMRNLESEQQTAAANQDRSARQTRDAIEEVNRRRS